MRFVLALLVLVLAVSAASAQDKRIALVIGNGAYKEAPLKNPLNDARAMATALQGLGFEVIKRENASQKDMNRAISEFATRLSGGGTGLFYYAGHGMQVKGRNYLLPVDAEIGSEISVRNEAIDVDQVLDGMSTAANALNIVILDACRNNPFERRFRGAGGGLAQIDAPKGALIAYATAPGKVAADGEGANGLYTAELLRAIAEPNLRVEDVFKRVRARVASATSDLQVPWEASSLVGDFYFKRQADNSQLELTYWQSVQGSSDAADFESYLAQFPSGQFTALARNRIRALQGIAARDQAQQQVAVAAEAQRQADAQRQAEAERVAAREAERQRRAALAAQAAPATPAPSALPPSPQLAMSVPSQQALGVPSPASLGGTWNGRAGPWRVEATVAGDELKLTLNCGGAIYRTTQRLDGARSITGSANRAIGNTPFPLSVFVKGTFPSLGVDGTGAPGACGAPYNGTLTQSPPG